MRPFSIALLGLAAIILTGCGSGPTIITAESQGQDTEYYYVDGNWLVYGWSPPVNLSRPIHMIARDLTTGAETELEADWYSTGIDLENGMLVYTKRGSIIAHDLASGTSTPIYQGTVNRLKLSGNTIVWGTKDETDTRLIAIGSTTGGSHRLIQDPAQPQNVIDSYPHVSSTHVVFCRQDRSTRLYALMVHDLSANTTEALPFALASQSGFDLSGDTIAFRKRGDQAFYVMNLSDRKERLLVDVPYFTEGPVLNGTLLAWLSHMPPEDFKGIGGQPLIDQRDFRDLNVINIDSGKQSTLIKEQFGLRSVMITDDKRVFALLPREITASPSRITDIIQF